MHAFTPVPEFAYPSCTIRTIATAAGLLHAYKSSHSVACPARPRPRPHPRPRKTYVCTETEGGRLRACRVPVGGCGEAACRGFCMAEVAGGGGGCGRAKPERRTNTRNPAGAGEGAVLTLFSLVVGGRGWGGGVNRGGCFRNWGCFGVVSSEEAFSAACGVLQRLYQPCVANFN